MYLLARKFLLFLNCIEIDLYLLESSTNITFNLTDDVPFFLPEHKNWCVIYLINNYARIPHKTNSKKKKTTI